MSQTSDDGRTDRSPRKGARVGPVSELSVFLKVKPGREQVIREVFNMPRPRVLSSRRQSPTLVPSILPGTSCSTTGRAC